MSADGAVRPVLTGRLVQLRPDHHDDVEPPLKGQFHDGLLMDMIRGELAVG